MFEKGDNTYLRDLKSLDIVLDSVADRIFDNAINYLSEQAKISYEAMRYMDVTKFSFYEMNVSYIVLSKLNFVRILKTTTTATTINNHPNSTRLLLLSILLFTSKC